jgi:hypothetical protein
MKSLFRRRNAEIFLRLPILLMIKMTAPTTACLMLVIRSFILTHGRLELEMLILRNPKRLSNCIL